jgi:hypothetical protein
MLSYIRQAIGDLGLESTKSPPPEDIGAVVDGGGREVEQSSTISSQSRKAIARRRKRKRMSIVTTLASSRTRREQVKYGITRVRGGFHGQMSFRSDVIAYGHRTDGHRSLDADSRVNQGALEHTSRNPLHGSYDAYPT